MSKKKKIPYVEDPLVKLVREGVTAKLIYLRNCIARLEWAAENETSDPLPEIYGVANALKKHGEEIMKNVNTAKEIMYKEK